MLRASARLPHVATPQYLDWSIKAARAVVENRHRGVQHEAREGAGGRLAIAAHCASAACEAAVLCCLLGNWPRRRRGSRIQHLAPRHQGKAVLRAARRTICCAVSRGASTSRSSDQGSPDSEALRMRL